VRGGGKRDENWLFFLFPTGRKRGEGERTHSMKQFEERKTEGASKGKKKKGRCGFSSIMREKRGGEDDSVRVDALGDGGGKEVPSRGKGKDGEGLLFLPEEKKKGGHSSPVLPELSKRPFEGGKGREGRCAFLLLRGGGGRIFVGASWKKESQEGGGRGKGSLRS